MATKKSVQDVIAELEDAARNCANVDESTSCSQAAFKVGRKAFLYVGEQGGRGKAMFKLDASLAQAEEKADDAPDDFQVGKQGWVTARFCPDAPLPARLWKKWLKESYQLAGGS